MSVGSLPPEDKFNVDEAGTTVDPLGDSTEIVVLVGGIQTTSYDLTIEFLYDGPSSYGSSDNVISYDSYRDIANAGQNDNLVLDVSSHGVIAGEQAVKVEVHGTVDGIEVSKEWAPNISSEPIGDYVYVDRWNALQSAGSLSGNIDFEVNVQNETISDVDVTFDVQGGSVDSNSPNGIVVPFVFSSTREIGVDLEGQEEVCCGLTNVQSVGLG